MTNLSMNQLEEIIQIEEKIKKNIKTIAETKEIIHDISIIQTETKGLIRNIQNILMKAEIYSEEMDKGKKEHLEMIENKRNNLKTLTLDYKKANEKYLLEKKELQRKELFLDQNNTKLSTQGISERINQSLNRTRSEVVNSLQQSTNSIDSMCKTNLFKI